MYRENNKVKHIFLIGFMGTGKSSVARTLGQMMGLESVDMDGYIEETSGQSIKNIFASRGEEYFRGLETNILKELSERENCVISCGGGVALREENREIMKATGTVVLLTASPETIEKRVESSEDRPLLKDKRTAKEIATLMNSRAPHYQAAADITVSTEGKQIGEICRELVRKFTRG